MDLLHSLDNLNNQLLSVRNQKFRMAGNGAVIEWPIVVSISGYPRH